MLTTANQQKIFNRLLTKQTNLHCADCSAKSPTWASIDFGVFVCLNCSGAHRALGPSVTRVRSTKLDTWQSAWLELMQIGNTECNQYWESNIGLARKPTPSSALDEIKRFVADKYVKRKFARQGSDPVTKLKISLSGQKPVEKEANNVKIPVNKQKNTVISQNFFETQKSDSVKSNNGSNSNNQKKLSQFDFFDFNDTPLIATTSAKSPQPKTQNQNSHFLDFNTVSTSSHHLNNFFNFNTVNQPNNNHHQEPVKQNYHSHSLNGTFSHPISMNSNNFNSNQFSNNLFSAHNNTSTTPIQYNNPPTTHSTPTSFDIFGTKPQQQSSSVNINMYVNTINFNYGEKKAQDKKDPFHALNEFGF